MNLAPERLSRCTLSENGKKASEPTATLVSCPSQVRRSSSVNNAGTSSKTDSQAALSCGSLPASPDTNRSIALLGDVRLATLAIRGQILPLLGSLHSSLELKTEGSLVESHPPVVSLVSRKSRAMDSGLLAGTQSNELAVQSVADGVGLSVFESNCGDS
jgi:hypothetical protein